MSLTSIYLGINALLYFILGAWCALKPGSTSEAVGFTLSNPQGFVEYIAVYGGMELGLGVFYLLAFINPELQRAGLIFSLCFYGGIVAFRAIGIATYGTSIGTAWTLFAIESAMLIAAVLLFRRA